MGSVGLSRLVQPGPWVECSLLRSKNGKARGLERPPRAALRALRQLFIQRCHGQTNLWFHAVSVGEVLLSVPLVKRLENKLPSVQWILSATTTTGMAQWHQQMPGPPATCFYPIDRRPWVRQSMEVIRPKAIILSEAEIWPNFLWEAFDRRIPVFLINARISEKSYLRYHRFRPIFAPLFGSLSGVGTQNDSDAQRLMALGCDSSKVFVTGNMKFDAALGSQSRPSTLIFPPC